MWGYWARGEFFFYFIYNEDWEELTADGGKAKPQFSSPSSFSIPLPDAALNRVQEL